MRPLWKGAISFGLVNIPVGLYSGIRSGRRIDFDLLRDKDLSRIHYKKVAEADGKEVPNEHIVKGYEYEKGHYVVIDPKDFERVKLKSTQMVDIREFVDLDEIEPRYFVKPYYLLPEKGGAKAYELLRLTLEQTGKAGVAKVVIRPPREHLALLTSTDHVLLLETMYFPEELRQPSEFDVPKVQGGQKELKMATSLVETMSGHWQPENYHDEYRTELMKVIEEKVERGGKELPAPKEGKPKQPKVVDLVALLQQSLEQSEKGAPKRKSKRKAGKQQKAA